ncbi:MAG: YhdH/YhfP family quinone oxidoreductase [Desulfuromonas thiophila]|jgi:putative YhdH/YhfP family quinone oxidoreductase|nr:YhdH/YhfP family quinone oxidoreductase [Desulfuromonas thiophila]MDD3802399.1 YhdH/YhfP family quinone oxidoreductase [Desulfuromonas thiophila]
MAETFTALQVSEPEPKIFSRQIIQRSIDDLPAGELLVRVRYSSLNYKDALSASGHPGVTRQFPHTPGIDAAGEVVSCSDGRFAPGAAVIVTSYDLGMETDGGFGQYIRVPSAWALPLPAGLSLRSSMIFGTAGLTAALALQALQQQGVAAGSPVLVTGATGAVGSLAVLLLSRAGYAVTAASGKPEQAEWLRQLGAQDVIDRAAAVAGADKPLLKPRWAGVVDGVGGAALAAALKACRYDGVVACYGLVGSPELALNVYPFILRGVRLIGIDSAECPMSRRQLAWQLLADAASQLPLAQLVTEIGLEQLEDYLRAMLAGQSRGRVLIRL